MVDDRVWLVANHSPEVLPPCHEFDANRGITIIRNPLDVIVSCLHLFSTGTHTKSLKTDIFNEHPKAWMEFVRMFIKSWAEFHRYWFKTAEENKLPIHFIRFEDLASDPKQTLTGVFKYALDLENLDGTVI